MWYFTNSIGVHITGNGVIDGQGLAWWQLVYRGEDNRPNMIDFYLCKEISFDGGLTLLSSPKYSINLKDCADIVIHDITIFIDSTLIRGLQHESVTYALNTDGIDIAAVNVTIYNTNITNYDDAIVAKP